MTEKRPISTIAQVVESRISAGLIEMGGLDDGHLKFLSYVIAHEFKISTFRFEMDYRSTPKKLTIRTYIPDGPEFYVKPKQADLLDKIRDYMNLANWVISFRERSCPVT